VRLAENAVAYCLAGPRLLYPFRAARLARRLHAECPFDVVTTEDPIRAGLAGALFAERAGVPLNVENHSLHINEPVWLASRYHHHLYNRIAIRVARRADSIRNYSPDQNQPLLEIGVSPERLFTIPAPAPLRQNLPSREAARRSFGLSPETGAILAAGRMVPYKNIGTLLEAVATLHATQPVRLLLAGSGPNRPGWQRHARRLGLGDHVSWLGAVAEGEMAALYAAANVFVAPAVHETGPRTIMEAFLAECPVVATPFMGVVHFGLCAHGETGLVVSPHDPVAMAEAIGLLLSDPAWARRMAREGRARVEDQCDIRRIARKVAQVLRETVRRSQPASPVPAHVSD
jgi:glycosyltransferase involved in cell wall biosynthesis